MERLGLSKFSYFLEFCGQGGSGVRFDVDEDVFYSQIAFQEPVFNLMGDGMSFCYAQIGGDLDMEVYVVIEAHFSDEAFFDLVDAGDVCGQLANFFYDLVGRSGVHDLVECGAQEVDAIVDDDKGGDESGPVVGGFITFSQKDGYQDTYKGGDGGDGITSMMVGVGFDGLAIDLLSHFQHITEHTLFYEYDYDEDAQREFLGQVMWCTDKYDGVPGYPDGCAKEEERNDNGGEGFGLAMPIGVFLVRWF